MPDVLLVPAELVTVTLTVPATSVAGDTAVIEVDELTVTEEASAVPNLTVEVEVNPVPVIVTEVPPTVPPELGDSDVTAGTDAV